MKTLTIKTAQNIPVHASYIIEVDGKKIGLLKTGETGYFDIEENAKSIVVKMQGAKTDPVDISENQHHALIIDSNNKILGNLIFSMSFLALSLMIHFLFKIKTRISDDASNIFSIFTLYFVQENQIQHFTIKLDEKYLAYNL